MNRIRRVASRVATGVRNLVNRLRGRRGNTASSRSSGSSGG